MIQLSIVIPKTTDGAQFEQALASVLGNRPADSEVIVVTAGVYDDPYELADEVDFVSSEPTAGLLDLINDGFRHARGEIVHVLLCGAEVHEGWAEPALRQFEDAAVGSVSPLVLLPLDTGRVAAAGVRNGIGLTRRLAGAGQPAGDFPPRQTPIVGPTMAAAFYRKHAIWRTAGVDPTVGPTLADLDLSMSLKKLGFTTRFEPTSQVSSAVNQSQDSKVFSNAQYHERLFWKHCNSIASWPWHFLLVTVELFWNLPHGRALSILAGRVYGMLCAPLDRYTRRRHLMRWPPGPSQEGDSDRNKLERAEPLDGQMKKTAA